MKNQILCLVLGAVCTSAWAAAPSKDLLRERASFTLGVSARADCYWEHSEIGRYGGAL
jgi:hypothetical protein